MSTFSLDHDRGLAVARRARGLDHCHRDDLRAGGGVAHRQLVTGRFGRRWDGVRAQVPLVAENRRRRARRGRRQDDRLADAGFGFDTLIVTAGGCAGRIVTDVATCSEKPLASEAVAVTVNEPDVSYVCCTVVDPLNAPSCCDEPSPKSRVTLRMFAVADTPTVNDAGTPAATGVVGPASVTPVRGLRPTTTVAVLPATLAVIVARCDVVSVVVADAVAVRGGGRRRERAGIGRERDRDAGDAGSRHVLDARVDGRRAAAGTEGLRARGQEHVIDGGAAYVDPDVRRRAAGVRRDLSPHRSGPW